MCNGKRPSTRLSSLSMLRRSFCIPAPRRTPPNGNTHPLHPPSRSSASLRLICAHKSRKSLAPLSPAQMSSPCPCSTGETPSLPLHVHRVVVGFFFSPPPPVTSPSCLWTPAWCLRKCNTNPKECRLFWSPSHLLWLPDVRSHTNILDSSPPRVCTRCNNETTKKKSFIPSPSSSSSSIPCV